MFSCCNKAVAAVRNGACWVITSATNASQPSALRRPRTAWATARLVTVERILPDLRGREEFVNMFVNEARITASLSPANIAQVYGLGQERDALFIAMEFIAGQTLSAILRRCHKLNRPIPMGFSAMV